MTSRPDVAPLAFARIRLLGLTRVAVSAGARPKNTQVSSDTAAMNAEDPPVVPERQRCDVVWGVESGDKGATECTGGEP